MDNNLSSETGNNTELGTTVSSSPVLETPASNQSETTTSSPTTEKPGISAVETLFNQNRALKEQMETQEKRIEALERKIPRFEAFMIKLSDSISSFFRPKGVNISDENWEVNKNLRNDEAYLNQRPSVSDGIFEYKDQLIKSGMSEDEANRRVASIMNAPSFENGYDNSPKELTQEEFNSTRPTFDDWRKEQINNAGGVTREVAQAANAMRDRIYAPEEGPVPTRKDRKDWAQEIATPRQEGVNINTANQIKKENFTTIGKAIDAKATDRDSAQALVNLYYGDNPTNQQ